MFFSSRKKKSLYDQGRSANANYGRRRPNLNDLPVSARLPNLREHQTLVFPPTISEHYILESFSVEASGLNLRKYLLT